MERFLIGVCDDDKGIHKQIKAICIEYLKDIEPQFVFFSSGEEVLDYCNHEKNEIELLFLDVQMEGINGIVLKDMLISSNLVQKIAFVTSFVDSVYDSFSKKTIGFVQKPIEKIKIFKLLRNTIEEIRKNQIFTFADAKGEVISFRMEDIIYLKAEGSYSYIYINNKESKYYILSERLGKVEKKLPNEFFVRVHKSYVVNLEYINIFKSHIELSELAESIPVGRTYIKAAKQKYYDYGKNRVLRRI